MEELDVEKRLKEDAQKVEMKDFSERWSVIKAKIDNVEDGVCVEAPCKQKSYAAYGDGSSKGRNAPKKFLLPSVIAVLFIAICLAIVLPLTLRSRESLFMDWDDLSYRTVSQSEFNSELKEAEFPVIDLSGYDFDLCNLYQDKSGKLQGGEVEVFDEHEETILKLVFCAPIVRISYKLEDNSETFKINNVNIKYATKFENDLYTTTAFTECDNIKYVLTYYSSSDNVTNLFEALFG